MTRLNGKISLITGAAQGIGLATAKKFAQEGATVVICDVKTEAVNAAVLAEMKWRREVMVKGWTKRQLVHWSIRQALIVLCDLPIMHLAGLTAGRDMQRRPTAIT